MKKTSSRIIVFILAGAVLTSAVVYGSVKLYAEFKPKPTAESCEQKGTNHSVVIQNNTVTPTHTTARLCDTLTVTNTDDVLRYMAFGRHDEHQAYDGITEKTLEKGKGFTVTLDKVGDYKFHDHLHDEVTGTFSVER